MAISYLGERGRFVMSHFRARRIAGGYLLTNDYGSWIFANKSEYSQICSENIKEPLASLLKEKGFMLDENNLKQVIKDYRRKCSFLFKGASLHIVVPTARCNLKCIYCHSKARPMAKRGYDMDKETARKTVDLILQTPSDSLRIEFQGGDAILNFPIMKYIVEYAKKAARDKEVSFSLVSNLTRMKKSYLNFIIENKIGVCTSLDGPEFVHDMNRQLHAETVKWIKKIMPERHINALMCVTRHSLPYHKEIVEEYSRLGLDRVFVKPANRLGFAQQHNDAVVSSAEFLEFYKKTLNYIVKKHPQISEMHTKLLLKKILTKEGTNFTDLQSPCGAATGQLAYDYDGSVYTCDEGRQYEMFRLGTVDNTYSELVASGEALAIQRASINDNPGCEACAYKPYCGLCPVCAFAETGNIIQKVPDRRCRIYMGMFDHVFEKLLTDSEYRGVFDAWLEKNF